MFSVTGSDRRFFFVLFRIIFVFLSVFALAFYLVSCAFVPADAVDFSSVPASSGTVGKFVDSESRVDVWIDPDTGVNYLLYVWHDVGAGCSVKVGGMCPRYNVDGSLMVSGGGD